jgi:uncharacterized membrane protein YraQ (UPF0718 family)
MDLVALVVELLQSGLGNLAAYLAAHVLLCLVPAFFIAGGMTALIPREAITRFLGRNVPKYISYPAAALAGSLLAVCSCTIVPLFAGIYKKGAGIGPAITFLFFAPAGNILALAYTGVAIGADLAVARLVLSLAFGIGIGLIMAMLFSRQDAAHDQATDALFANQATMKPAALVFLLLLVALLLAGTFKIDMLTNVLVHVNLPSFGLDSLQEWLVLAIPFDAALGQEGVTAQGAILIGLLLLIAVSAWKGLNNILDGFNHWTWIALSLVALTLMVGALGMSPQPGVLELQVTGRFMAVVALLVLLVVVGKQIQTSQLREWLWESWRFVKQIFPLLVVGVFAVGIIRQLIQPQWIQALAGQNTIFGNLAGVVFGVFMYFPTLVEVPIAQMFLSLGMHRGPLLAYLMADPELSLQSILILATIIGRLRAWTYVGWVALFSLTAGLIYGSWVNGWPLLWLVGVVALFLAALIVGLHLLQLRNRKIAHLAMP